jgi:DNA-3-methyladenine glycosylase II
MRSIETPTVYPQTLTIDSFLEGVTFLGNRDSQLANIISHFGPPPFWTREAGFPTLVHIILEQQVSLASAKAAFAKLNRAASPLTPQNFLAFSDVELKSFGFSRQKAGYCRGLAKEIVTGNLDLGRFHKEDDAVVKENLLRVKGIGTWTADIYLLMALRRPDVWPVGDLALAAAVQELKGYPSRPSSNELDAIGKVWRPWRAIAARILWHYYLRDRG